jgi:hypothetical protein
MSNYYENITVFLLYDDLKGKRYEIDYNIAIFLTNILVYVL